jgi:recombination protein RecA
MSKDFLSKLRDDIKKNAKGVHASILSDSEIATSIDNLPTPSYDLNRILSGSLFKGIPSRSLSLFVGPEASGKSSFMCLCLAEAQAKGYKIIVIDTEGAWTKEFVERWGLDSDNMLLVYTPWVNEIMSVLGSIRATGEEKYAIVVDSVGAMERGKLAKDAEDGEVKADQGMLQKEQKRMMKLLQNMSISMNSIVMCSGHYYGSPGQYGAAEEVGGGKYMKLAPQIIISLKKTKLFDSSKNIIGNAVKAIALKNRFYPPFEEALIEIDYRSGINRYAGMIDLAAEAGICSVGGSWFTINGEKYQGRSNAEDAFEKDPEILVKLNDWLGNTGYSTLNNELKSVEEAEEEDMSESEKDDIKNEIKNIGRKKK